ncbi:uncharacterized protein LOC125186763 [Salvia hispanica]|uniref:uncharacterized protein LOC125186763 n=1 Tax=Salvia hispanica TaxID=49212 RepID=UPI0020099146|nr:uncharacterized protein LOC125186763 [Salvia hispanica]
MEGGSRFMMLWTTVDDNMYYHSFDELGLKDCNDRDLVLSGFKRNPEAFPIDVGFFCVGHTLFMVGGMTEYLEPTNGLWSALPPPYGSFSESWTVCPATMKVKRSVPILVQLHDGRIFICGGTNEQEGWAEIYDPKKGEFEGRNLPRMEYPAIPLRDDRIFIRGGICEREGWAEIYDSDNGEFDCPHPISCFQWTDQVVMVYYHHLLYSKRKFHKPCQPSLLSYNIAAQQWEIFADNLPPPLYDSGKRNLVYVGGNILFIIDFACTWFVYDLSSKKEAGEVLVKGKPRGERVPVKGAFYAGNKDIKSTSWVLYVFMPMPDNNCDLGYAKVEVVQGKGGDYFATFQIRGVLKVGPFYEIYIFAENDKKGKRSILFSLSLSEKKVQLKVDMAALESTSGENLKAKGISMEQKVSVLADKYKGDELSSIVYGGLLEWDQPLHRLRIEFQALVAGFVMKLMNRKETGGQRFRMLWTTVDDNMYYHSFNELGLKDCNDRDLVLSGFKRNPEAFPIDFGFFCVGDALFMVGGMTEYLQPTNGLWSALPPPDGSFSESWTLCPVTMKVKRSLPILVPLPDGRIFICGGTNEREGWAEIYDPKKGEFEGRNLPRMEYPATPLRDDRIFIRGGICEQEGWDDIYNSDNGEFDCPHPISCFQWTDQVVMVYYHHLLYTKRKFHKPCQPSLISYNIAQQQWEYFADNLPPPLYDSGERNLVYVGGDILFIIDFACTWFVYDLSSKKEAGEVLVKGKPRGERVPVKGAFYAGNKDIKSTSWVLYVFMPMPDNNCDLGYAKVEVIQGKGGDYFATFQIRGVLKVGPFYEIYIFADKDKKGKEKIEMIDK